MKTGVPRQRCRALRRSLLLLPFLCCVFPGRAAWAQCCAAGNPVNTNSVLLSGGAGVLHVAAGYLNAFSDTYYHGTQKLEKTYAEIGYSFTSLAMSYGLSSRLRLSADLGYYIDKSQRFVDADYTRSASGLADATVGLLYDTYANDEGTFRLTQSVKVTLPVGAFDVVYEGVTLPIDFQPSSGNTRYNLGLLLSQQLPGAGIVLLSANSIEFSQAVETRNTYHRYGNLYNLSFGAMARLTPWLQGLLQLRWEIRDRALNGTIDVPGSPAGATRLSYLGSSGGVTAFVSPQLAVDIFDGLTVSAQFNYPFYKNAYGEEQLTTRHSFALTLSRGFTLFPSDNDAAAAIADPMMPRFTLAVRGACEMCKERIEAVAAEHEGVSTAQWNDETQQLTVFYRGTKPDPDALERALAAAGHDTAHHRAPDAVYRALPACCHYRP